MSLKVRFTVDSIPTASTNTIDVQRRLPGDRPNDVENRNAINRIHPSKGLDATSFTDPIKVLKAAQSNTPDLLVSDVVIQSFLVSNQQSEFESYVPVARFSTSQGRRHHPDARRCARERTRIRISSEAYAPDGLFEARLGDSRAGSLSVTAWHHAGAGQMLSVVEIPEGIGDGFMVAGQD
jgi:hypothetical protein